MSLATQQQGRRKPWRLRTRLAIALIAIFAAIFILNAVTHYQTLNDRQDSRVEAMHNLTRTVAALLDGFTNDLETFALTTSITLGDARVPISVEDSSTLQPSVGPFLQHLFEGYGILRAIFVTDTDGRVVYSNADGSAGTDLSNRSYIQALQQGADGYWSEGFAGAQSGNTTIAYSRRIIDPDGRTTGYLVVALYPDQLIGRLPANLADDGHISLIDQNGRVLFHVPDNSGAAAGTILPAWADLETAHGQNEVVVRSGFGPLNPEDKYGSLVSLERVEWIVGYSLPASAIEGSANAVFQRNLLATAVLLASGLAIMLALAHRFSKPLARLAEAAAAIARGEPGDELASTRPSDGDLATLATTMEYMRTAIERREHQLRSQAAVLESVEQVGESLASELDLEKVVQAITRAGKQMTNAEAVLFLHRFEEDAPFEPVIVEGARSELTLNKDGAIVGEVLKGSLVQLDDCEPEALSGPGQASPCSVLGIPLRSRSGEVQAALILLHSQKQAFGGEHRRLASGLARWASIVLDNARLFRHSQEVLDLLRQANLDKDEFLSIVSHELRTPITTIYGGTRLLRLRRDKLPADAIEDMITSVAEESERLYHLVEDLLAIGRLEMSEGIEREPVSLPAVMEQATTQFGRGHKREFLVNLETDLPPVLAEPTYLLQIITNLLTNADKYSPADQPIEIDIRQRESQVRIRVVDHGPGVPADELPRIFDSFYRSREVKASASGKGLGLTVCKRLVEALSGRIWAANRPEGGLEVTFELDAAEIAEPAVADGELV